MKNIDNPVILKMVRKLRMDYPEMTVRNIADAVLLPTHVVCKLSEYLRSIDPEFAQAIPKRSHPNTRSKNVTGVLSPHPIHREIINEFGRREGYYNRDGTLSRNLITPLKPRLKAVMKSRFAKKLSPLKRKAEVLTDWEKLFRESQIAAAESVEMLHRSQVLGVAATMAFSKARS